MSKTISVTSSPKTRLYSRWYIRVASLGDAAVARGAHTAEVGLREREPAALDRNDVVGLCRDPHAGRGAVAVVERTLAEAVTQQDCLARPRPVPGTVDLARRHVARDPAVLLRLLVLRAARRFCQLGAPE